MGFGNILNLFRSSGQADAPADYTDARLRDGLIRASQDTEPVQAVSNAVMLVAQAAARCTVTCFGDIGSAWQPIVSQGRFISTLMRDLMLYGNAVYEITDPPDLMRAGSFEVYGKKTLRYRLTHPYPDGQTTKNLVRDAVCHVLINANRDQPWLGRSPFENSILAPVERGLIEQALMVSKRILTMPGPEVNPETRHADRDAYTAQLAESLKTQGYMLVQSKNARGTDTPVSVVTLRMEPDQQALALRENLVREIWEAIGYPPILRADTPPGQAEKDARAAWIDGWLASTMDSVAEQLSEALACDVKIDTTPAKVPQIQDQSKIVAELAGAGIPLDEAKRVAGL